MPPNGSAGTGSFTITVNPTSGLISWNITFGGLSGPPAVAHIHGPAAAGMNAGVLIDLAPFVGSPTVGSVTNVAQASVICTDPSPYYVNIHNAMFPGGEIRGQLA